MADPLSVTAALVGIVGATGQGVGLLYNTIQNIRKAPESIKTIRTALQQLRRLLTKLEFAIKDDPAEFILSTEIKDALENCNQACTNFSVSLTRWARQSSLLVNAKIGLFRQGRIRALNEQLGQSIKLLNITLGAATLYVNPIIDCIAAERPLIFLSIKMSQQQVTTKQTGDQMLIRREPSNESVNGNKEVVKFTKPIPPLDAEEDEAKRPTAMSDGNEQTSGEVPKAAVPQSTKQNVGQIKTFKSMSLVGRINDEKSNANFDQQISTVHTTGGGIAIAGVANNVDINALLAKMGQP